MIKDYPMAGCKYIRSLKTFNGIYPNGRELRKCIGQNGFETLVKYKVLKSVRTLGHRWLLLLSHAGEVLVKGRRIARERYYEFYKN